MTKMRTSYAQKRSSMAPYPEAGHTPTNSNAESTLLFGESGSSCTSADSANPPIGPGVVKKCAGAQAVPILGGAIDLLNPPPASSEPKLHSRGTEKLKPRPSSYMPSLNNDLVSEPAADFGQLPAVGTSGETMFPLLVPRRRPVSDATLGQRAPFRRPPNDPGFSENHMTRPTQLKNEPKLSSNSEIPLPAQRKPPSGPSFGTRDPASTEVVGVDSPPKPYAQMNNSSVAVGIEYQRARLSTPAAGSALTASSNFPADTTPFTVPSPTHGQTRVTSASQRAPFAAGFNVSVGANNDPSNGYAEEWLQFKSFLSQYLAQPQNRRLILEKTRTGSMPCLPYMDQLLQMQNQNPQFAQTMLQHVSDSPQNEHFLNHLRSSSSASSFGHSRALSECFQSAVSHFAPARGRNKAGLSDSLRRSGSPGQYPTATNPRRTSLSPLTLLGNQNVDETLRRVSQTSDARSVSYGSVGSKVGLSIRESSNAGTRAPSKIYRDFSNDWVSVDKKASIMSKDRISDYNALFFDEEGNSSFNCTSEEDRTMLLDGTPHANDPSLTGDGNTLMSLTQNTAEQNDVPAMALEFATGDLDGSLAMLDCVASGQSDNSASSVISGETDSSIQHSAKFRRTPDAEDECSHQIASKMRSLNSAAPNLVADVSPAEPQLTAAADSTEATYEDPAPLIPDVDATAQVPLSYYDYPAVNAVQLGYFGCNQSDSQDYSRSIHTSPPKDTPVSLPVTRRSSQFAMNFEVPDHGYDARSDFSARLSALTMNHRAPQSNPEKLKDLSSNSFPSTPTTTPRWNQSPRAYVMPPPFLLRHMSHDGNKTQSEYGDQYGTYNQGQQYGHGAGPYQQGSFQPSAVPEQFRPMSPEHYNAMKRMLFMSLQAPSQSPCHSPSATNFGMHASSPPASTGNSKLDSKINKLIELRQVIASGNKSAEYRLKWVKTIIDSTNCGVYEHFTIKGDHSPPGQEARSQAMFVKSCITQLSKLLNECKLGKHAEISVDVYYLHGCLAMHAFRNTYCQDYGIEKDFIAATAYFDRCLEIEPENSRVLYRLGELHELMDQDDIMPALSCYKRSAKAGYNRAIFKIGMLYLNDSRVRSVRVIRYLTNLSSIDLNDIKLNDEDREDLEDVIGLASFQLGRIYEGIYPPGLTMEDDFIQECLKVAPVNYAKSLAYYNKSAKLECLLGQVKLGNIYEKGELDRPPNPSKSVQWYLKASSSPLPFERHPEAMMGMVRWCFSGTNLMSKLIPQPNPEKAVYWCELAIEQFNLPQAYFLMGELASSGFSNSDPNMWYNQARELGYQHDK